MQDWCPFAIQRPLAIDHSDKRLQPPTEIVLHITEGTTPGGAWATWAASVKPKRVSGHLIVCRDGAIWQAVPLSRVAWHASQVNYHSIGIEFVALSAAGAKDLNHRHPSGVPFVAMPATDEQYASGAKLLAWLCKEAGIPPIRAQIRTHNEASPIDLHTECCTGGLNPDHLVSLIATVPPEPSILPPRSCRRAEGAHLPTLTPAVVFVDPASPFPAGDCSIAGCTHRAGYAIGNYYLCSECLIESCMADKIPLGTVAYTVRAEGAFF